jgi:hypothetical protein
VGPGLRRFFRALALSSSLRNATNLLGSAGAARAPKRRSLTGRQTGPERRHGGPPSAHLSHDESVPRRLLLFAGMRRLAALEIGDETSDLVCSCLRPLDRADSVEDGVTVDAVELGEEAGSCG